RVFSECNGAYRGSERRDRADIGLAFFRGELSLPVSKLPVSLRAALQHTHLWQQEADGAALASPYSGRQKNTGPDRPVEIAQLDHRAAGEAHGSGGCVADCGLSEAHACVDDRTHG